MDKRTVVWNLVFGRYSEWGRCICSGNRKLLEIIPGKKKNEKWRKRYGGCYNAWLMAQVCLQEWWTSSSSWGPQLSSPFGHHLQWTLSKVTPRSWSNLYPVADPHRGIKAWGSWPNLEQPWKVIPSLELIIIIITIYNVWYILFIISWVINRFG